MLNKIFIVGIVALFAAGCGVKAQTYVMNKERADQERSGNGGCLSGKCAEAPAPARTTRKVYVLEVTKPLPESEIQKIENETRISAPAQSGDAATQEEPVANTEEPAAPQHKSIVIPSFDDQPSVPESATGPKEAQSYTVLKDDTLQKISKKFYGTYSKWTKIYDANKAVIKNPNFVKPGTVLSIPAAE